jgi:YHS domain-containing protein
MKVDRDKATRLELDGETHYFCSEHCRSAFETDPDRHRGAARPAGQLP